MTSRPASTNVPAANSGPRGKGRRRAGAAIIALLAVLSGAVVSTAADRPGGHHRRRQHDRCGSWRANSKAAASSSASNNANPTTPGATANSHASGSSPPPPPSATGSPARRSTLPAGEVRIVARKLESGRIEFGLQQRQPGNTWGDRQLSTRPLLPHHRPPSVPGSPAPPLTLTVTQTRLGEPPPKPPERTRRRRRRVVFVRAAHGNGDHRPARAVLGSGARRAVLRRHRRPEPCAAHQTAQSPAGATTNRAGDRGGRAVLRGHRPHGAFVRAPTTAPSPAGDGTPGATDNCARGQYSAITASINHSCAAAHRRHHHLLGMEQLRCRRPWPTGNTRRHRGRSHSSSACATTATRHTAGAAPTTGRLTAPSGQYFRHHRHRTAFVRAAHRRHHHLLGLQRPTGGRPRPAGNTPPSPPASTAFVRVRTDGTITCWGQTTTTGRRPRPTGNTPPSPPATWPIRAGCAPTAPSPAGDCNDHGQATAPDGQYTAVTAGWQHSCGLRTDGTITCWGGNN